MRSTAGAALCATAAAMIALGGCQGLSNSRTGGDSVQFTGVSAPELREQLIEFYARFEGTMRTAADRIYHSTDNREIRRMSLMWRMRVIPSAQDVVFQADPRQSLLDLWVLCEAHRLYIESEDAVKRFGDQHPIALEAATGLARSMEELARGTLPSASFEQAKVAVGAYAQANRIDGISQSEWERPSTAAQQGPGAFQAVLTVPFKALGGVDNVALAIDEVAKVTRQFTMVTRSLPERVRWQAELLLYDIEDRQTTQQARDNLASITASLTTFIDEVNTFNTTTERLVAATETLPEDLRAELSAAMDDMAAREDSIRQTTSVINESLERIERASAQLASAGNAWTSTTHAVDDFVKQFRTPDGAPPPLRDPNAKPFDINDYALAAERFTELAVQLQKAAAELNASAESGNLAKGISDSVAASEASAARLVSAVMWRTLVVVGVVFGLVVVYRLAFAKK